MKTRLVIFDLDGTLLNTEEGLLRSIGYTLEQHGKPALGPEALRRFIGPPIQESFMRFCGADEPEAREMAATFRARYKDKDLLKAHPYQGIYGALAALSKAGLQIAVATNKRQDYAERILDGFQLLAPMAAVSGTDFAQTMNKADVIRQCLTMTGCSPEQAVMVGDTMGDAAGAAGAKVPFLGVLYGFGFTCPEESVPALGWAKAPGEISEILLGERE